MATPIRKTRGPRLRDFQPILSRSPRGVIMRNSVAANFLISILANVFLVLCLSARADSPKSVDASAAKAAPGDADLIKSAMSAAPAAIGQHATIVAMEVDDKMRVLRKGTNGFTCMADNPTTPGPDPMCMDANAVAWVHAWIQHKVPPATVGIIYMLAGGTDASNTDPYAEKPTAENHWIQTGPHIMVVGADKRFYDTYPKTADPDTTMPYVMWSGTPYQHLMAPVK
jgi:hypothetical protein